MLFITNRRFNEGPRSDAGRKVSFDLSNNEPTPSVFFCQRQGPGSYCELTSRPFFRRLSRSPRKQILLFFHGYNALPEQSVFVQAQALQMLADRVAPETVQVVPMIWPTDDDIGLLIDYWDDQAAAEMSGTSFARGLGKFLDWRDANATGEPCLKHMNILAHSMGNRVLRHAVGKWVSDYGPLSGLFRNIFMAAADVADDTLDREHAGSMIADAARNLVVYHAADDFALRTSKIVNLRNKVVSRRLGHAGPRDMGRVPQNVVSVDCNDFNGLYDRLGHSYFLAAPDGQPGLLLRHMMAVMDTGRVPGAQGGSGSMILRPELVGQDELQLA